MYESTPLLPASPGFDTSYFQLPERFYRRCLPEQVRSPELCLFNRELCAELGIFRQLTDKNALVSYLAGNTIFADSEPLAMAYAGHQFGHFVPQLGDGRALLLGEIVDQNGLRHDIQLKGSGHTPFSRGGDGRSPLGPMVREYLVSEAMYHLGIPSTRALALVTTGEDVLRQDGPLPGGILTRVGAGFIRIGTFEYFAARQDTEAIKELADYAIARHFPTLTDSVDPYLQFFKSVCERQAHLVAQWMLVGFIHGVMNTDNTAICGETIDYGPCAFLDHYDPNTVFSSIDMQGRYRFANQGAIMAWNLGCLGACLSPLLTENEEQNSRIVQATIDNFQKRFMAAWQQGIVQKIGLYTAGTEEMVLVQELFAIMQAQQADYTLTFRYLADNVLAEKASSRFLALFNGDDTIRLWLRKWRLHLNQSPLPAEERARRMNSLNPAFIPRNHRIEKAVNDAERHSDFREAKRILAILKTPFADQPEFEGYMAPPQVHERITATFCGT